jgi:uncharacterized protein (TIGR00251 family)
MLQEIKNGISFNAKIIPKASSNKLIGWENDLLKIKIKEVPDKGKANKELIIFLSKIFKVAKSNINIAKGETSRKKKINIISITIEEANGALNIKN